MKKRNNYDGNISENDKDREASPDIQSQNQNYNLFEKLKANKKHFGKLSNRRNKINNSSLKLNNGGSRRRK